MEKTEPLRNVFLNISLLKLQTLSWELWKVILNKNTEIDNILRKGYKDESKQYASCSSSKYTQNAAGNFLVKNVIC